MLDLAQKLLSLSEEMLRFAEEKEWQAFTKTQAQRAELIDQLNQIDTSKLEKQMSDNLHQILGVCRTLEKQCTRLVETHRDSLTAEQSKLSKGKAMQKAYGAYGRKR